MSVSVNEKTTAHYRTTADYRNEIEQREAGIVCGAYEDSYDSKRIDQYDGLRGKYMVIKADTGELVMNCFVLRPDRDPAAVTALRAYAEATDNETLASDIISWIGVDGEWIDG